MKKTALHWLILSAIVLVVDLLTKYWVVERFALYDSVELLPIFNLTYVRNYGAAFSFLADHAGWQQYFFILLALVISSGLIYALYQNKAKSLTHAAYSLIIGGALANMIDRAYHGFVVDFFDVHWGVHHYPVFNVADIGITCGAGLLILEFVLESRATKKEK